MLENKVCSYFGSSRTVYRHTSCASDIGNVCIRQTYFVFVLNILHNEPPGAQKMLLWCCIMSLVINRKTGVFGWMYDACIINGKQQNGLCLVCHHPSRSQQWREIFYVRSFYVIRLRDVYGPRIIGGLVSHLEVVLCIRVTAPILWRRIAMSYDPW